MRVSTLCAKFLLVIVAVTACGIPAGAVGISLVLDATSPSGVGPFVWTYNATLPTGFQLQPSPAPCTASAPMGAICDGLITIYDFAGYVPGSEFAPSDDWMFVGQLSGPTPVGVVPGSNVAGIESASIFNLAWIYTGGAGGGIISATVSDILLGGFGASSVYSAARPSEYATRSNSLALANGRAVSSATTLVPAIPEPATIFLLGTGLLGVAGLSRRRKRS